MKCIKLPPLDYFHLCFNFNFDKGEITYKFRESYYGFSSWTSFTKWNDLIDTQAFNTLDTTGYLKGQWEGKNYLVHRILYYVYYRLQPLMIDHIDRNKQNNNILNLRASSSRQNSLNTINNGRSPTDQNAYIANILHRGKTIYLGRYRTENEAIETIAKYKQKHNLILEPKYLEEQYNG